MLFGHLTSPSPSLSKNLNASLISFAKSVSTSPSCIMATNSSNEIPPLPSVSTCHTQDTKTTGKQSRTRERAPLQYNSQYHRGSTRAQKDNNHHPLCCTTNASPASTSTYHSMISQHKYHIMVLLVSQNTRNTFVSHYHCGAPRLRLPPCRSHTASAPTPLSLKVFLVTALSSKSSGK